MTLVDPTNPAEVDSWVLQLLSENPKEHVVGRVWAAIQEAGDHFPTVLAGALFRLEGPRRLRAEIESGRLARPPDHHPVANRILRGEHVTDDDAKALLGTAFSELELAATLRDQTEYISYDEAHTHGIDLELLMRSPALRMGTRVRERVDAVNPEPEDRKHARRAERMTAYQSSVLRRGHMLVNDPRTGDPASYLGYLTSGDALAYRFGGHGTRATEFYLLARGPAGQLRSLYLPDRDLLIDLDDTRQYPIRPLWPAVKMQLARAVLEHADPTRPDRPAGRRPRPRIVVRVGGAQNFAHVLWNYYGGLAREELLGNLPRAKRVQDIGSEFFGPLTEIYPEIGSVSITHRPRAGRSARNIDNPRQLLIPIGSTLLWPEALDRVHARARSLDADPVVVSLLEQIAPFRIRVYVALRVRDKSWADADEQLPRLIDEIVSRHPDACVLLDGFSVPSGVDHVTSRWEDQQRELRELVDTIRSRVREPDRVVDLIGLDLLRSIAVISEATCYLCPAGTAHHKVDWFIDIPGVIYISEQMRDRKEPVAGHRQRRASHEPRVVVGSDLGPEHVRIQRLRDRRGSLANFALPWERVWTELEPLLRRPGALRSAATAARRFVRRIVAPSPPAWH